MEPELAALVGTAATTVVTLLATEAWEGTRDGIAAMWRRVRPERADAVAAQLDATREDLTDERIAGDEEALQELQAEWRGRMRRLLVARPEAAEDLRRLLDELAPGEAPAPTAVTQRATASGQARVYQAGRDQHVREQ